MTHALFVTYDAGGNVPPALGIAQRLLAEGGTVLVLGSPSQRAAVESAGLPFEPYGTEQAWTASVPVSLPANLSQMVRTVTSRAAAADVVRVARRESPDVVVVDCMLFSCLDAAVGAGFRTVSLVHTLPSFFAGGFARGPVGRLATLRGHRPARVWASAAGSLATVLPGFDTGDPGSFTDLRTVGPVVAAPTAQAAPTGASSTGDGSSGAPRTRPRVLISLSTNWFPGQERTLQKLLDAVDGLDLDVVATTGRSIEPRSLRAPAGAELFGLADHELLLAGVDLLVGHGGHGTTMRALAHDVPVLVLPSFGFADQPAVGLRIAGSGAGRTLPTRTRVPELRQAIAELAAPGPHRAAAAAVGARLRALDPAGEAVKYLVAGSGAWPSTPPTSRTPSTNS